MADGTVFIDGCMFVDKGTLFVGVAPVARHISRFFAQITFRLTVGIVAVGASHLALLDGMVGGQLH